jgi:transcriptional regulator with XRE-family HTH domain
MLTEKPSIASLPQAQLFEVLKKEFDEKQARNPLFSLRAYAKQLDMSAATLSRILNAKRTISKRAASRILDRIQVDKPLIAARLIKEASAKQPDPISFSELDADRIALLSDWHYFAILSLAETAGFKSDSSWVAARLGIPKREAQKALSRLERLELLERTPKGALRPSGRQFTTTDRVRNLGVRRTNRQFLELATKILDRLDEESLFTHSDFSGMTMAIDPKRIVEANRRIRAFRRRLCAYLEGGEKTQVYRLAIQLFPLSHSKETL